MGFQEVHGSPRPLARRSLYARYAAVAAGAEVVVKSIQLRANAVSYLHSLAFNALTSDGFTAVPDGNSQLQAYLGGAPVGEWWGLLTEAFGDTKAPEQVGAELPAACLLEFKFKNKHATDAFDVYIAGEIHEHDEPLR